MKAILMLGTVCVLSSTAALASSAVEFGVAGRITPGPCYPTLSHHVVDFGEIKVAELLRHTATVIDRERLNTLDISCDGATVFGIRGVDDRASSVGNQWYPAAYGLGTTGRGENIGAHYVEVHPDRSSVDGDAVYTTLSDGRGEQWDQSSHEPTGIPNDGRLLGLTDRSGNIQGPVPVKHGSLGLTHFMVVAPASGLTLTGEVLLDGKATLELIYL